MSDSTTVYVNILDKDYQVACPPEEKSALNRAALELDKRMRAVRASSSVIGLDRIAVMTALNLCHELQQIQQHNGGIPSETNATLERLAKKLDTALAQE